MPLLARFRTFVRGMPIKRMLGILTFASLFIATAIFLSVEWYHIDKMLISRKSDIAERTEQYLKIGLEWPVKKQDWMAAQELVIKSVQDRQLYDFTLTLTRAGGQDTPMSIRATRPVADVAPAFAWLIEKPSRTIKSNVYSSHVFHHTWTDVNGDAWDVKSELRFDFSDLFIERTLFDLVALLIFISAVALFFAMKRVFQRMFYDPLVKILADTSADKEVHPQMRGMSQNEVQRVSHAVMCYRNELGKRVQEIERIRGEFESQIESSTFELRNALTRASASEQSNNMFLNSVGHELRQPLFSLSFALANMQRHPIFKASPDLAEYASRIGEGIKRASDHIDQVLEFSRSASGAFNMEIKPLDIFKEIESIFSGMAPSAYGKGISFDFLVDPLLPNMILSCRRSLYFIARNIIGNAIKLTHEGGIEIHLYVDQILSNEEIMLGLKVVDTGIGIPKDQVNRIFEPFVKIDDPLHKRGSGYGIGLSIAMNRLRDLGGRCEVLSSEAGSTFTVTIPVKVHSQRIGTEQRIANNMLHTLHATFAVMGGRTESAKAIHSRLLNAGAEALMISNLNELVLISAERKEGRLIVIAHRMNSVEFKQRYGSIKQIREIDADMLISLEPAQGDLETLYDMSEGRVDLILSAHTPITTLLNRIKAFLIPVKEHLHDIFLEQSAILERQTLSGLEILLIDDDQASLEYLSEYLISFGAKVKTAQNAEQGERMSCAQPFDAIFIDLMMPGVDGIELGAKIRACKTNPNTPLFALSGAILDEKAKLELDLLNMTFIRKLEARDTVVTAIRSAIAKRRATC